MQLSQPHLPTEPPALPTFAERTSEHLFAIVHRWPGHCQPHEQLQAPDQSLAADENPAEVLVLGYLADLRLRFVFTQPGTEGVALARASDLARLDLTPTKALALATLHLRQKAGAPTLVPQSNGTFKLQAPHHLLLESHLLDRTFWKGLLARFPAGMVLAMPRRGCMLLAAADDTAAQGHLFDEADALFAAAGPQRLSGCLLRFDQTGWRLHVRLPSSLKPARRKRKRRSTDATQAKGLAETKNTQPRDADSALPSTDRSHRRPRQDPHSIADSHLVTTGMQCAALAGLLFLLAALLWGLAPGTRGHWAPLLGCAAGALGAAGSMRLAYGLGRMPSTALLYAVVSFTPLANVLLWATLSHSGFNGLRDAGWHPSWRTLLP